MEHMLAVLLVSLISSAELVAQAPSESSEPRRPRVLIIGDHTYSQHTRELPKLLKDRVEIVYATWKPGEIADTATTLEMLDRHLGRIDRNGQPIAREDWPKWDLIHFNCGLGDLIHRVPGMKTFRVLPIHVGGVRNTSPDRYESNLQTLVQALKAKSPEARLVWASTTPIRASATNVFELGSEVAYNGIAQDVMSQHGIAVNDMYGFAKGLINMEKPAGFGADPFHFDKKPIHMPIVRVVEQHFGLTPLPKTEEERVSRGKREE